jgi:hypothetical protein
MWPFAPSTALCSLYGHLSLCGPLLPLRPSVPSMALCPFHGLCFLNSFLSSLLPSVSSAALIPSMVLCPLQSPLSSLWPSVSSTALCLIFSPLYPLWPFIPSTALCSLYSLLFPLRPPLSSLWPPVSSIALRDPSMAHCPLCGSLSSLRLLSPLQPFVPSKALCPLWPSVPFYDTLYQCCGSGSARIRIIFQDPDLGSVPRCSRIRIRIHKLL